MGPPIGVLPRNTTAVRARTLPRIDGSARSWTSVFVPATSRMVAPPTGTMTRTAIQSVGASASANMSPPSQSAAFAR